MNRRIEKKQITRDCRTKIQNDRYRIKLLRVYLSIYKKWIYVGDGGFSHPNCDTVLRLLPVWYHPTTFAHWAYDPHHTPVIIDIDMPGFIYEENQNESTTEEKETFHIRMR